MPKLPEWVMLDFGSALAGVVLVTVIPAFRASEVEHVLQHSRAAGVFAVEAFRGNPMWVAVQQVAPNRPELRECWAAENWSRFDHRVAAHCELRGSSLSKLPHSAAETGRCSHRLASAGGK